MWGSHAFIAVDGISGDILHISIEGGTAGGDQTSLMKKAIANAKKKAKEIMEEYFKDVKMNW